MRFAVKSSGGVTEAFLHADDIADAVREAARQIIEDYEVPVRLELWTAPPNGGQPGRRAAFRFVAVTEQGELIDLD